MNEYIFRGNPLSK